MGDTTKIQWTDHTFNAWIGCHKVSPGCKNCYAAVDTFARTRRAEGKELWGLTAARHITGADNWKKPLRWNREAQQTGRRARVFCSSLSDVFESRPDLPEIDMARARLWSLIEQTPALDWLLLTKRPENIRGMLPRAWLDEPRHNVWLGTTVEKQAYAEERIPHLLAVPAAVRFLSLEPLLGPVNLNPPRCQYCHDGGEVVDGDPPWCVRCDSEATYGHWLDGCASEEQPGINWVIVGGESGSGAREFQLEHARRIVWDCRQRHVPVFVKQLGARAIDEPNGVAATLLGAPRSNAGLVTLRLRDNKGGDISEFPQDLRVREFPEVARGW